MYLGFFYPYMLQCIGQTKGETGTGGSQSFSPAYL